MKKNNTVRIDKTIHLKKNLFITQEESRIDLVR